MKHISIMIKVRTQQSRNNTTATIIITATKTSLNGPQSKEEK